MRGLIEKLKQKGPLGMPIGFWVGFAVIAAYLGYRWYSNRSGSGPSSSGIDSGAVDTGGGGDGSTPAFGDPNSDTQTPDTSLQPDTSQTVAPLPGDSTDVINGAIIGEKSPKEKKKAHKGLHDHKQRMRHTAKRAIHRRKKGIHHTSHAPTTHKKVSSHTKRQVTSAIPSAVEAAHNASVVSRRLPRTAVPPHIRDDTKKLPPPVTPASKVEIAAKKPPVKAAAKRKR